MPTKFYSKELSDSPVYVNGHPMKFDVLATEDPMLQQELDNCVRRQVGGVMPLTKEQYEEEVKKKQSGLPLNGNSKPRQSRQEITAFQLGAAARAADRVASPSGRGSMFAQRQRPDAPMPPTMQSLPDPLEATSPEEFVIRQPPTTAAKDLLG